VRKDILGESIWRSMGPVGPYSRRGVLMLAINRLKEIRRLAISVLSKRSGSRVAQDAEAVRLLILVAFVMAATPVFSIELFRYRGAAKDGGTLEYIFEAGEQNSPNAVTKEEAG
jgi:hypothetical protein